MKTSIALAAFLISGFAFADFNPADFVGAYHVDPARSDADCIGSVNAPVQIQGDALNLRVTVTGATNPNVAIGGADIQFEEIGQPAQESGNDGFDQYQDISSCTYQDSTLTQYYNSQEPPYPATIESTTLKKNSDGSLTLARTTSGMAMDSGPSDFSCTLVKN